MGQFPGAYDYFEQQRRNVWLGEERMKVYSIEWKVHGRTVRKWFESESSAASWLETVRGYSTGKFIGPLAHEIEGPNGLVSFLDTYAR